MNKSMPRCSTFDFPETNEVSSLEIAIAMLEFPQRRLGRTSMKNITDWPGISEGSFMRPMLVIQTLVESIHI